MLGPKDSKRHVLLGRLAEVGPRKELRLDVDREHVVAVLGKRGSGKTHTLGVLVEALGLSDPGGQLGQGPLDHAVLVFDTLNLFQWIGVPLASASGPVAKQQLEKALAWNLPQLTMYPELWHLTGSVASNSESKPFQVKVADMRPQDWGLLMDVDTVLNPMGQLIATAHDKVARTGWQSPTSYVKPILDHSIPDLAACIAEDQDIAKDFVPDTRRAVRQRLNSYERTGMFSTGGTPLAEMLSPGKVSILLLARASEDLRTLVVFLLIRKLMEQRSAASEATKDALIRGGLREESDIPKTWVIIDEAQNIIPARTASFANRELTRFVREGRNFGLSMGISTQQPGAIDSRVMAQVDVLMAHTLTVQQDTSHVVANLKSPPPADILLGRRNVSLAEAIRELQVGQCLLSAVDSPRAFFVDMRPRVTPHGGFEA